jgi:plasmid stabilization system protein ParE
VGRGSRKVEGIAVSRYDIVFSSEAELDLLEACAWYELQLDGLGEELEDELDRRITDIASNPSAVQFRHRNVRVAFLRRFPYGIHFLVEADTIKVIAIFHMSRNPTVWGRRG